MSGITDPTEQYFKDGVWGWDGTRWRNLPLLWGYTDRYAEMVQPGAPGAGANFVYLSTPPAGQVWTVSAISAWNNTRSSSYVALGCTGGSVYLYVLNYLTPPAGQIVATACNLVLKNGDKIFALFGGCGIGDSLGVSAWGYKMGIT